jgi:hypothetical protein
VALLEEGSLKRRGCDSVGRDVAQQEVTWLSRRPCGSLGGQIAQ